MGNSRTPDDLPSLWLWVCEVCSRPFSCSFSIYRARQTPIFKLNSLGVKHILPTTHTHQLPGPNGTPRSLASLALETQINFILRIFTLPAFPMHLTFPAATVGLLRKGCRDWGVGVVERVSLVLALTHTVLGVNF